MQNTEDYEIKYGLPTYYAEYGTTVCANTAGAIAIGYYDRFNENLIPNYKTYTKFGEADEAIKKLEPLEQQLITLNYYEGLNQREISEKLGISQMQVSRKLKKALSKLFEIISKKGLNSYE